MADEDHILVVLGMSCDFHMHLGDQRAGGIEHFQVALPGFLLHAHRHPVGAEDHRGVIRDLVELLDEDRALAAQVFDHEAVVHDLMPDVDGRTEQFQRALDDLDRTIDAGTESAWVG